MANADIEKLKKMVSGFKSFAERIDNGENITDEELKVFAEEHDMTIADIREGLEDKEKMQEFLDTDFDQMEEDFKNAEEQTANMDPKELEKIRIMTKFQVASGPDGVLQLEDYEKYAELNNCSIEEAKEFHEELKFSMKSREPREDEVDIDSMSEKEEKQYWKDELKRRQKLWEKDVLTDNDIHDLCEVSSMTRKEVLENHRSYVPEKKSETGKLGLLGTIIRFIKNLFKS